MPTEWELGEALRQACLARYLMTWADERGMTHGEKHHLIFVALGLIVKAQNY